mgnify:CR=1 FL=1
MIKYALVLALFLCATAQADVVARTDNLAGTLTMELHDTKGECSGDLLYAQIVIKGGTEAVAKGCWAELNDVIGILWAGETEIRVAPRKTLQWVKTT